MPLPKPNAGPSRRGLLATDRILPSEGRQGPPPKWPSAHKPSPAERALWRRLWSLPQACAWEAIPGTAEIVSRYCRTSCLAARLLDEGKVHAALLAQLRAMEMDLGLTAAAMARLRWTIDDGDTGTSGQVTPLRPVRRQRPRAVDPVPRLGD
jgi:hypothetical protein